MSTRRTIQVEAIKESPTGSADKAGLLRTGTLIQWHKD
jgi:hypothetical protein